MGGMGLVKKDLKIFAVILLLGSIYGIWIEITGLAIPCVFRKMTGWLCPGCGITTLCLCLVKMDFRGAYEANPFLFLTFPFLIFELFYLRYINKEEESTFSKINMGILILYLAALLGFGFYRNLML